MDYLGLFYLRIRDAHLAPIRCDICGWVCVRPSLPLGFESVLCGTRSVDQEMLVPSSWGFDRVERRMEGRDVALDA